MVKPKQTHQGGSRAPAEAAKAAGLRYVLDDRPGILRRRRGPGFSYFTARGDLIRDPQVRERIKALKIPPAWADVWICPWPKGHLQATGRDARGRKQYLYHPQWQDLRSQLKFERMGAFAKALPAIRQRVEKDLSRRGISQSRVLAAVVRLLELSLIRIGNRRYREENETFGLTTLQSDHVEVYGPRIRFEFTGKSGRERDLDLQDRRLARIISECMEIPGQELFHYQDEEDQVRWITADEVNAYLADASGGSFTAKDFRTWRATVLAAEKLAKLGRAETNTATRRRIVAVVKEVAEMLGNQPAVCSEYYVHPRVIAGFLDGSLEEVFRRTRGSRSKNRRTALDRPERTVQRLLAEN